MIIGTSLTWVAILGIILIVLIFKFSKEARKSFWSNVLAGLLFATIVSVIAPFLIEQITPHPEIRISCENIKDHKLELNFKNVGNKEAQSFYMVIYNPIEEGDNFYFSDEVDKQFCYSVKIPYESINNSPLRKDITKEARTVIKCEYLPPNFNVELKFDNWASHFKFQYGANNLQYFEFLQKCGWSEECSSNPTSCGVV